MNDALANYWPGLHECIINDDKGHSTIMSYVVLKWLDNLNTFSHMRNGFSHFIKLCSGKKPFTHMYMVTTSATSYTQYDGRLSQRYLWGLSQDFTKVTYSKSADTGVGVLQSTRPCIVLHTHVKQYIWNPYIFWDDTASCRPYGVDTLPKGLHDSCIMMTNGIGH